MTSKKIFGAIVASAIASAAAGARAQAASFDPPPPPSGGTCSANPSCAMKSSAFGKGDPNSCSGKECPGLPEDQCKADPACVWTPNP
jgi:hypothetical protein